MKPKRRKNQPERVRAELLRAAGEIAVERGAQAVTMDAVAEQAGVSKGALQYHFPSKQKLLDALFISVTGSAAEAKAALMEADPDSYGREVRANLTVSAHDLQDHAYQSTWRVLIGAMISEPSMRERWSKRLREANPPEALPENEAATLMICRLAAEGIWITDLFESMDMSPSLRAEVLRQLEAMTRRPHQGA